MKFHRRSLVTHKKLQYGFILFIGVFGGVLSLLNIWIHAYLAQQEPGKMGVGPILVVTGAMLVICVPVVIAALIFTNRVAGPLKRLQNHMESAVNEESPSAFKFRDHDFLQDLEVPYNRILERLRNSPKNKA